MEKIGELRDVLPALAEVVEVLIDKVHGGGAEGVFEVGEQLVDVAVDLVAAANAGAGGFFQGYGFSG